MCVCESLVEGMCVRACSCVCVCVRVSVCVCVCVCLCAKTLQNEPLTTYVYFCGVDSRADWMGQTLKSENPQNTT